mgnify:CR=1 FL=1
MTSPEITDAMVAAAEAVFYKTQGDMRAALSAAPVQPEPPHSTVFRVEQDGTGLFIGTSPQFHGLLVAKTSLLEAIRAIPDALEALILASPAPQSAPSGGFPRDDFTHTANLLRSGDEAVIKATLSNNLNVIIAALDRAAVPSGEGE